MRNPDWIKEIHHGYTLHRPANLPLNRHPPVAKFTAAFWVALSVGLGLWVIVAAIWLAVK
jgi:hypothetical protein